MDPLSDILSLLKPQNSMSAGFDVRGDWSIRFPGPPQTIKCGAMVHGHCWVSVEGVPGDGKIEAVLLQPGDCFLLPGGRPFILASDPALTPVDVKAVFSAVTEGGIVTRNGGGEYFMISSRFSLDGEHADLLLRMLPPIVHLRKESDQAALRWSVERMMQELRENQPGSSLVLRHLAQMVLVQALRQHLSESPKGGIGWLFALADRQMGAAISAMHNAPAQRWTLQALAGHVGMSRSSFALRFKETVGVSPMDYLTRWRMLLAGDRLTGSGEPVSTIALSLGYESESAFSTAFKRVMGCSPRQYGRSRSLQPPIETRH